MVVFILELFLFGCHFHFYFSFNDLISALVMSKLISRLQVIFHSLGTCIFCTEGNQFGWEASPGKAVTTAK